MHLNENITTSTFTSTHLLCMENAVFICMHVFVCVHHMHCLHVCALEYDVKMASAVERTDDLVREYLIYRGFTSTLKYLDSEIKADKEKGFRVSLMCGYLPPHVWRYMHSSAEVL